MSHAIFTASDAGCGDFVLEHLLHSLRTNVRLDDVDVHVLDYGLTPRQRVRLRREGVTLHPCRKDGHVANVRIRDLAEVLSASRYDQVLNVDAGDIIFQADVRHLFDEHKQSFRAVCEEVHTSLHETFMGRGDFPPEVFDAIIRGIHGKPTINAGVLLAPAAHFCRLWDEFRRLATNFAEYGSEQLVINYLLYRDGFVRLDSRYNFVLVAARQPFHVRDGVFYDEDGAVIPIVHNAGGANWLRRVERFGFGPGHNRPRLLVPTLLKGVLTAVQWLHA